MFTILRYKVVHPAPGNATGTLVNGILHHCSLPIASFPYQEVLSDGEAALDDELSTISSEQDYVGGDYSAIGEASIRPGIVHRLDKGTSGLLVVAKVISTHSLNIGNTNHFPTVCLSHVFA